MPESANPKHRPTVPPPPTARGQSAYAYAELDVTSNFSFLRGASHPDELVYRAAELGHKAIAFTDLNSLAGIVRAHQAAEAAQIKFCVGTRLRFTDAPDVLIWVENRTGYANLCRLLTLGKRRAEKGSCTLHLNDLLHSPAGLLAALVPQHIDPELEPMVISPSPGTSGEGRGEGSSAFSVQRSALDANPLPGYREREQEVFPALINAADALKEAFGPSLSIAIARHGSPLDEPILNQAHALSERFNIPLLATNQVHYHTEDRQPLQDVLTCIRHGCTIREAGFKLFPNGERFIKSPEEMHHLFAHLPRALKRTIEIADRCNFSLNELRYEYPNEIVPSGKTSATYLSELTWLGAHDRYPRGIPPKILQQISHELTLIEKLHIEPYFLTVYDLVRFARSRNILCQGRGSAANSAVCFCLGVTSVDPNRIDVLFERFVSTARNEPPDIDIDFEHERREEVIQYVYEKYGRDRAGMTAEIISYRGRSAVRDVGKAMGLGLDAVDSLAKRLEGWHSDAPVDAQIREAGLDPTDPTVRLVMHLTHQLLGFPRHLSQHVGGMVMTRSPLCELVPIENASMPNRTVIEWDKDDIDALHILKVDVLALGMLTAISKALALINAQRGTQRQRNEETKRQSDADDAATSSPHLSVSSSLDFDQRHVETECTNQGRDRNGKDKHVPGLGGLAKSDGISKADLRFNISDAQDRTVRVDDADSAGSCIGTVQYCRGIRPPIPPGPAEISTNFPRVIERISDSNGADSGFGNAAPERENRCSHSGNGPCASRTYSEPGKQGLGGKRQRNEETKRQSDADDAAASSPHLSVSSSLDLSSIPPEDPGVYVMASHADTVGVFQIESRAQMSMLPRLKPKEFYDLVIEVAIVRPGPIQGDMVHPYLRRRMKIEKVSFPKPELEAVLGKTLGVPLFQEQAMKVAIVAAGFSPEQADRLRRAVTGFRRYGDIDTFAHQFIEGMVARGYARDFAERCFAQLKGFSTYGFPESHAASFALLVYASCWIKRYHPAAFCCALLNSQPMGFYAPAQLVRDAQEHGVSILPIDVNHSDWDCTLEQSPACTSGTSSPSADKRTWGYAGPAVRLGLRMIKGFSQSHAEKIMQHRREHGTFQSIDDFHAATHLSVSAVAKLSEADAFGSLPKTRRIALWETLALPDERSPLIGPSPSPGTPVCSEPGRTGEGRREAPSAFSVQRSTFNSLPPMTPSQEIRADYTTTGLSLKGHPLALLRNQLTRRKIVPAKQTWLCPHGKWINVAGIVIIRQRPGTAKGIIFMTLEDETGVVNLIIHPGTFDRFRSIVLHAKLLQADGPIERVNNVQHLIAMRLHDLTPLTQDLPLRSRDFH